MTFNLSFSFKLLAVVLSLAIVIVSLPLSAFAGDNGSVALESLEDENSLSTSTNADIFEMDNLRTADAKTFRLTDGSFYTASYNTGIHEQDEDGNWINIDNRLHQNGGFISTKNGRYTFQEKTAIDIFFVGRCHIVVHNTCSPKETGTYLIKDVEDKVIYVGKGSVERMNWSMRFRGGVSGVFYPAASEEIALANEAFFISSYGGARSVGGMLKNLINSPGLRKLFEWF